MVPKKPPLAAVESCVTITFMKKIFLALVIATATGCSTQATEPLDDISEGEEATVEVDELSTTGPTYQAGAMLTTKAALNLRETASTSAKILRVMPANSDVKVRERSGSKGWVAISFDGFDGFAHTQYLSADNGGEEENADPSAPSGGDPSGYSATRGNKLANTAIGRQGRPSGGQCALYVSNHVENSGVLPSGVSWRRNNATSLGEAMAADSAYTRRVGFQNVNVSMSNVPKGTIIVWDRGQCGYSSKWGHIEIAVDSSSRTACSDFCGSIKKSCGKAKYLYMPTNL
jgi:uncharacterized protein YraI